jgi:predicted amidohydrolase YtcJ
MEFADSHLHLLGLARVMSEPPVGDGDVIDVLDRLRDIARDGSRPSGWIVARGYDDALVGQRRLLRRRELDDVAPIMPLRVRHRTGHASLLNTAAFRVLGRLPRHARLELDDEGEPVLLVDAEPWLNRRAGRPPREALVAGLRLADALLLDRGITRAWDATPRDPWATTELRALLDEAQVRVEVRMMRAWSKLRSQLTGETVKLFPHEHATPLASIVHAVHARGAAVAIHATTEQEVEDASLALAAAAGDGIADRVEHATLLSARQASRLAAANATIVTHPGWLQTRAAKYREQLDARQRRLLMPFRTALAEGCRLAFASDAPVEMPAPDRWLACATAAGQPRSISHEAALRAARGDALWARLPRQRRKEAPHD